MANLTFKEVVLAASKLSPAEKAALVQTLQESSNISPTHEQLLAELNALHAAGAFDHVESLRNKYANPAAHVRDEELRATIHEAATEWEQELDEFFSTKLDPLYVVDTMARRFGAPLVTSDPKIIASSLLTIVW